MRLPLSRGFVAASALASLAARATSLFFLAACTTSLFFLAACATSTSEPNATVSKAEDPLDLPLPVDPLVKIGKLENGLTYYIEKNTKPEQRAVLRLVVNAGSVLEDDDQLGLAHLVEHMAFNGTENFAGNDLIKFLESIGVKFGAHLNAHTGFDETVYKLQIPTDDPALLDKGMLVLADWAGGITFDPEEVEKERGVVIEEWRRSRGAGGRIRDQLIPLTFHGSIYKDRLPIGTEESLKTFPHDALKRFYRDWYRPDLMAVVAVGDFDPAVVESLIKDKFSGLKGPENPRARVHPAVPDHEETLYGIFADPEVSTSGISITAKFDDVEGTTHREYRHIFVHNLLDSMMNERFGELSRDPNSPMLGAGTGKRRVNPTKSSYSLGAGAKEGKLADTLKLLLTEVKRAKTHGFTDSELKRAKARSLRTMQSYYDERDTSDSSRGASEIKRVFINGEPMPGVEYEHKLANEYIPNIKVEEINDYAKRWMPLTSRVVTVVMPQKEGLVPPTTEELKSIAQAVAAAEVKALDNADDDRPLMAAEPSPGKVTKVVEHKETGIIEWRLSNGAKVLVKPTKFQSNQVQVKAYSWGGSSKAADKEFYSASAANRIRKLSGLGPFDATTLQKKLAGKKVGVDQWVSEQQEGLSGSSSVEDLSTLFKLIHLAFTQPRLDERGLALYLASKEESLRNRLSNPTAIFSDRYSELMWGKFMRYQPWELSTLNEIKLDAAKDFYVRRFSNAGDFTFVFVGNVDPKALQGLVETYLASLPDDGKREAVTDLGAKRVKKGVTDTVKRGIDPKSSYRFTWHGAFEDSRQNRVLIGALSDVLSVRLREELREKMSGTYSVRASASTQDKPRAEFTMTIKFSADPEKVAALSARAKEVVAELIKAPPKPEYVQQLKAKLTRSRETNLKSNSFWSGVISAYDQRGEDLSLILDYAPLLDGITDKSLHKAAKRWLKGKGSVEVVLLPEAAPQG